MKEKLTSGIALAVAVVAAGGALWWWFRQSDVAYLRQRLPGEDGTAGMAAAAARGPFSAWEVTVLSNDERVPEALGLRETATHALYNGALPVSLRVFAPARRALRRTGG